MANEAVVEEHVKNMGLPESTGRHILDAVAVVEEYLRNQKEIVKISKEAEASEEAVKTEMRELDDVFYKKQRELDDEKSRKYAVLNNKLITVKAKCKDNLKPLWEQVNQVKRIIVLLRIAESFKPVPEIKDDDVKAYNGAYLEWLDYVYNDDFLKIRLLIAENRKPKNRYSLIAYGRCAFRDKSLIELPYTYGIPNLNDWDSERERFTIRFELGSFPTVEEIKTSVSKYKAKVLRGLTSTDFMAVFEGLKKEYLDVTERYRLSDFEQITAKEGST